MGDNDAIADTDRDYTGGARFSVAFDELDGRSLQARIYQFMTIPLGPQSGEPTRAQLQWILFGQSVFTPDHTTLRERAPGDRPFAGWLYTGLIANREVGKHQLDSFEIEVGTVGPAALAYESQASFHRLLGQSPPFIGSYQLQNEPGLLLAFDRRWKIGHTFENSFGVDLIPGVGVTAGNIFTYANAGIKFRIGRALENSWGPELIRPTQSGATFFDHDASAPFWGFNLFAGIEDRVVARNITLDGNSFASSPRVTRNWNVFDEIAGVELFNQAGYQLSFTIVRRTREYTTQPAPAVFGSIGSSLKF